MISVCATQTPREASKMKGNAAARKRVGREWLSRLAQLRIGSAAVGLKLHNKFVR